MYGKDSIRDFGWKEAKTGPHDYLLGTIMGVFEEYQIPNTARILDAGCGGGYILSEFYKRAYRDIWGFDASESGIDIAKQALAATNSRFEVHNAYHRELPSSFPQTDYDIILSVEVIEHMYSPMEYLNNVRYWLKEGGLLIMTTPYHGYIKNMITCLLNKFDRHFDPLQDGGHIKFFSRNTLSRLLEEAGIKPLAFHGSGRFPFLWKSMLIVGRK